MLDRPTGKLAFTVETLEDQEGLPVDFELQLLGPALIAHRRHHVRDGLVALGDLVGFDSLLCGPLRTRQ